MALPTWRVVIDPQAEAEARASFRWYLARSATAAAGFQVALKEAIDSLAEAPYRWPEVEDGIRRRLLSRFPYSILYEVDEQTVIIVAVMHHSRHPSSWKPDR
jgi:plasmid stabilization system protein ParE